MLRMPMLKEFKEFVARGNVMDLAVGVVMGAAFGKIVTSLVNDLIMPFVGLLLGRVSFTDLYVSLNGQAYASLDAAKKAGAPVLAYGVFLNTCVEFLIVAFTIFLVVRQMNKLRTPKPAA
jgi:large conductance mechanosensitive channel